MVHRKVVENYFSILRDTLLSYELPVFARRAKRELTSRVKFYFFDAGVFRVLRPAGPYDADSELGGLALETLVLQEIAARNSYENDAYRLYYWRTRQGLEVDFVLYGERGFKAIEVKHSDRARARDFKGLRRFKKDHPEAELMFVYLGSRRRHEDGVEIIPAQVFFSEYRGVSELPGQEPGTMSALLEVRDLKVRFATEGGWLHAVDGVDFQVERGENFTLLGESGSGKSVTALAVSRLLPRAADIAAGAILLNGVDLLALPERAMRKVRGRRVAMIFQEPQTSLNPVLTVETQIGETLRQHQGLTRQGAAGQDP